MPYSVTKDDNFQRNDAGPGSAANSQAIGGDWTDVNGTIWGIRSNLLRAVNNAGGNPLASALLRPASENTVDGRVRIYVPTLGSGRPGAVFRYADSDQSGVGGFVYNNSSVYFNVNGGQSGALSIGTTLTAPYISEWTCTTVDQNTTEYSVKFFYQSDENTQVGNTVTFDDTTPALQGRIGRIGVGAWNEAYASRVVVAKYVAGGIITPAPVLSLVTAYRTSVALSATAAAGGNGTLTYQLYESDTAGQLGTAVTNGANASGVTSLAPTLSSLTPGHTYYFTVRASDGTQTADSNQLAVTTVKSRADGGHVIVFTGDSITFGSDYPTRPARLWAIERLRALGITCEGVNDGHPGYTSAMLDGAGAVAKAQQFDADTVSLMIGTNDASATNAQGHQFTQTEYKGYVRALAGYLLGAGTGINTVVLEYCIGRQGGSGTVQQNAQVDLYNAALDDIATNDNLGGRIVRGDNTIKAYADSHASEFTDIHLGNLGHQRLGTAWGNGLYAVFTTATAAATFAPSSPATLNVGDTFSLSGSASDAAYEYKIGAGAWLAYTAPVTLGTSGQIMASGRATRPGFPTSTVATASYNVQATSNTPTISGVTLLVAGTPVASGTVMGGQSIDLDASVQGTNNPPQTVTWAKESGVGSVDSAGVYTAPTATSSAQAAVIRATASDGTHFAEVTITIPAQAGSGGDFTGADRQALTRVDALLAALTEAPGGVSRFRAAALAEAPVSSGGTTPAYSDLDINISSLTLAKTEFQSAARAIATVKIVGTGQHFPDALLTMPIRIVLGPTGSKTAPVPDSDNSCVAKIRTESGDVYAECFLGDSLGSARFQQISPEGIATGKQYQAWLLFDGDQDQEEIWASAGTITVF